MSTTFSKFKKSDKVYIGNVLCEMANITPFGSIMTYEFTTIYKDILIQQNFADAESHFDLKKMNISGLYNMGDVVTHIENKFDIVVLGYTIHNKIKYIVGYIDSSIIYFEEKNVVLSRISKLEKIIK